MSETDPDYPYGVLEDERHDGVCVDRADGPQQPSPFGAYYDAAE